MKKILIAFVILATTAFAACNNSNTSESKNDTAIVTTASDTLKMISAAKYTCTMHTEVISDTPGHCPKCEMALVPVKDSTAE